MLCSAPLAGLYSVPILRENEQYEKKKRYLKQSLLVAELTEQQKHNKQQAQPTTALLVHGTIPAFCQ